MAKKISGSVGKGGKNDAADVESVQKMLNNHAKAGGFKKLKVDGDYGKKTLGAIEAFQTKVEGLKKGTGLIESGKSSAKALANAPAKRGAGKVTGKTSGVKKELLEFLQEVADHYGTTLKVTLGKYDEKKASMHALQSWGPKVINSHEIKMLGIGKSDSNEWNDLYIRAVVQGDPRAEREFMHKMTGLHHVLGYCVGVTVDLEKSTPKNVRAALKTGLEEVAHAKGLFYSMRNGNPPQVTEKLKAKWKR